MAGTANDLIIGSVAGSGTAIAYNPAMQMTSITRSNTAYSFSSYYNTNRSYATNGLNQHTASGSVGLGYDSRGNLTTSGSSSFGYNKLNQLVTAPGLTIRYDPMGRLSQYDAAISTRHYYSGSSLMAEVSNPGGTVLRRYVPGPGTDEPVVWYQGSGATDRRFLQADERGSIVAISDSSGNAIGINRYDEYGIPALSNIGRFQYTGQTWYPELGMYNYKARIYSPTLGRFMQTDPIGYGDGLNWYSYVGADPVNAKDPSGTDYVSNYRAQQSSPLPSGNSHPSDGGVMQYVAPGDSNRGSGTPCPTSALFCAIDRGEGRRYIVNPVSHNFDYSPRIYNLDLSNNAAEQSGKSGRTGYCRSALYKLGDAVDNTSAVGQKIAASAVSAGVLGKLTHESGAGDFTRSAVEAYGIAGIGRVVGQTLKAFAGSVQDIPVEAFALMLVTKAAGVDYLTGFVADIATETGTNYIKPKGGC